MEDFDTEQITLDPSMTIEVRCLAGRMKVPCDMLVNAILLKYFWNKNRNSGKNGISGKVIRRAVKG